MKERKEKKDKGFLATLALGWDTAKLMEQVVETIGTTVRSMVGGAPRPPRVRPSPPLVHVPPSVRAEDRITESEEEFDRDERLGTWFVVIAFAISFAGGIGFLFAYWWDRSNLLLGGCLGLFFLGIGVALVFWSHLLMRQKEAVAPREVLPSPPVEREATEEDFCTGMHEVRRRGLLKWMAAASVGLFVPMAFSMLRSLGVSPDSSLFGRIWKRGQRLVTIDGKPMSIASLELGSSVTVFPEDDIGNEHAQTVLIRVKPQSLDLPKDRATWAPDGYVAYSRVCTHAGCPVAQYEAQREILLCPCHQSTFDVLRGAAPTGGPAARPLPQLPLYADADGTLRAGGGFTAPPGPGFWGIS